MGRKMRDFSNYWSTGHHALLLFAAKRALSRYPCSNITVDELVNIGWLRGLRRVHPNHLFGCYKYTFLIMITYIHSEVHRKVPDCEEILNNREDHRENLETVENQIDAVEILTKMEPFERNILLDHVKGKSLKEIGKRRGGLSGERIRQLKKNAITSIKLRNLVQRRKYG